MSHNPQGSMSHSPSHFFSAALGGLNRGIGYLLDEAVAWSERRSQRRELLALPEHLLRDIGISRVEAEREGDKPCWRN